MSGEGKDGDLVAAVQAIYKALAPLDAEVRERVITSALSLLGMGPRATRGYSGAEASTDAGTADSSAARRPDRTLSPVELVQEKNPATNSQKIALFAYYRERYEDKGRFSRADLKSYFGKAKESPPGNYDRDFNNAVKQGWIHEDGDESYLTSKGLEAVEAGFAGKALPRGRAAPRKSKPRKKPSAKRKPGRPRSSR